MPAKPEPRYWATCVVEGVFLPERGELISSDGQLYPAHQAPGHRRWATNHPEDAMEARLHVAWPRTTAEGVELALVNSYLPMDSHCEHLEPLVNRCSISGVVTNQKPSKGLFVMRVMRNAPAPKGKHRDPPFRTHLLFIHGLVQPLSAHLNRVVRLDCSLEGGHMVLDSVASIGESLEEALSVGGIQWPWPFLSNAASIKRLAELNPEPVSAWIPLRENFRETLEIQLEQLQKNTRSLMNDAGVDRKLARDADRVRIIGKRMASICKYAKDDDLRGLLKRTKLLTLLNSFQIDLTAASKMPAVIEHKKVETKAPARETKVTAPAQPAASTVPEGLEEVADLLLRRYPDDLIGMGCNMTAMQVRLAMQQLVSCGWYDALSPEQQRLIASYQLKRVLKLRN